MDAPRPMPVLSYTGDDRFGWSEHDGDVQLSLPHPSNWTPVMEHGAGLLAATVFTIISLGSFVIVVRSLQPVNGMAIISAVGAGLLVIGVWAGVVVRFVRVAKAGPRQTVAVVRITSDELEIVPPNAFWARDSIADLKMSLVSATLFRPARVRLEVQFVDGNRDGVWLPWPQGEPVDSHELRLRELLKLKPISAGT